MITAIIRNKENTLVLELPHSIYDIYEKLQSIGIMQPPKRIPLTDNEDEDIGVKLFSESDFGQHLLLTLHEKNTIADANNEKYKGDAIINKTYITDCISKKVRVNNGERPKYYVENSHPAIIDSATFGRVQEELARRSGKRKVRQKAKTEQGKYSSKYATGSLTATSSGRRSAGVSSALLVAALIDRLHVRNLHEMFPP